MTKNVRQNKHCPICQQTNNCCNGLDKSFGVCWCTTEVFPEAIFDLVPANKVRKACICKKCLDLFKVTATENEG